MSAPRNDGGPAFPSTEEHPAYDIPMHFPGMTLRDWFATSVDKDEYGDLLYRNASRSMMEAIAGSAPIEPKGGSSSDEIAAHQLAKIDWELRFRAAIRYRMADAMLAERAKP